MQIDILSFQDWFKLKPLQVDEGTRVSISSQNLQVEADYQKYGNNTIK